MFYIKPLQRSIPIGLSLILVAIAHSAAAVPQVRKQSNPPPPPTNPGSSAAGGRRSAMACAQDPIEATNSPVLTALSPTNTPGLTLAEHPTFLVFVPETGAQMAEFSLRNQTGNGVYRTTVALTNTPTIISITLPEQAASLDIGKRYTWTFAIICNPGDRLEDQFVTATIQRTEIDPTHLRQLEQDPPQQRIASYQENGIWYDALALLFELKRTQPNDASINTAWRELLQSGGLNSMIDNDLDPST